MNYDWKRWKMGLLIAILTGAASCFAVSAIVPGTTWKELGFLVLAFVAKDVLLFLNQHPADSITFDTVTIKRTDVTGASVTATHSTVTQPPADPAPTKPTT